MGAGGVPSETWRPKGAPWTCGRESIGGGGDTQDKSQSRGCAWRRSSPASTFLFYWREVRPWRAEPGCRWRAGSGGREEAERLWWLLGVAAAHAIIGSVFAFIYLVLQVGFLSKQVLCKSSWENGIEGMHLFLLKNVAMYTSSAFFINFLKAPSQSWISKVFLHRNKLIFQFHFPRAFFYFEEPSC